MDQVTIQTVDNHGNRRNVTLVFMDWEGKVRSMGIIPHGTQIIVNQELVDSLQKMVNDMKTREEEIPF